MELYGLALLDFFKGDTSAKVVIHRDDGLKSDLPISIFFRTPSTFYPGEQSALDLCRGYVLDVGAGAGCDSLVLQERGLSVCALDISPQAIEIMLQRGVRELRCANIFEFNEGPFDTLLMMSHGIGVVENLAGLDRFLNHARQLIQPDGQILLDSLDVRHTDDIRNLAYHEANRRAGRYLGEIRMQFEYQGQMGPLFGWLHVDPETLIEHASYTNWSCQIIHQEKNGDYLAQLSLKL
jgi:SAM-dependent methyltransferase